MPLDAEAGEQMLQIPTKKREIVILRGIARGRARFYTPVAR